MQSDSNSSAPAAWLHAVTILLSAFLLFLVQPLISKAILPWFGGATGVWTTCLLFFQLMLLAGYCYAHFLAGFAGRTAWRVHGLLLLAALALLPITPHDAWKPTADTQPVLGIAVLLFCHVGLAYFLLASTGPLVQAWFARGYADRSPYRLYALSNIGSLGALFFYPFFMEPRLPLPMQGWAWSGAFALFAGLSAWMAYGYRGSAPRAAMHGHAAAAAPAFDHLTWLALPAFASALLLIVTDHLCRDVAVSPFLWIVPLALYLLTFIICFDSSRWYRRDVWPPLVIAALLAYGLIFGYSEIDEALEQQGWSWRVETSWNALWRAEDGHWSLGSLSSNLMVEASVYLALLFTVCMICHGELVRRKPAPALLTRFYLMIAAGGALGGIAIALVAPLVFKTHFEWGLALIASAVLAGSVLWIGLNRQSWYWQLPVVLLAIAMIMLTVLVTRPSAYEVVARARNFYGILRVTERYEGHPQHGLSLVNGRILHGYQYLDPSRRGEPCTYYTEDSGVGVAMLNFPRGEDGLRVGVVGLGAGSMAAYAEAEDEIVFYEINPAVVDVARNYFSFLSDCPGEASVELGDARITMERELRDRGPRDFHVLVLDAFSSDAIPIHLLTEEAFQMYWRHMAEDGVIVVHTSNLHLDLLPVVRGLADRHQREAIVINFSPSDEDDGDGDYTASSEWVLVTNNQELLQSADVRERGNPVSRDRVVRWTDQYSSLLQVLN